MIDPETLLPLTSAAAGALMFAAALLVGYVAQSCQDRLRSLFYGALSLAFTIAGAAAIFGNLISILGHR
jgi:hypothetical protein